MSATVKELKDALKKGIVEFQFMKKDGSIRTAKGTTNHNTIERNYTNKGGDGPSKFGYTSYWDVEKNDWRCFDENKFIDIINS